MAMGFGTAVWTIRRFPDEEGTEICPTSRRRAIPSRSIRRFPDEEGTEIWQGVSDEEKQAHRSEDSPMRRGLKCKCRTRPSRGTRSIRRFPDEEGTEIREAHGDGRRDPAIRRFPDEEGTEIEGQGRKDGNGYADQKIPR